PAAVALLLLASAVALPLPILGGLAELTEHLLQTLDLALVGDLLDFGVLDELEHLFHVGERALESVHDAFDLETGLFGGTRCGRAVREGFDRARDGGFLVGARGPRARRGRLGARRGGGRAGSGRSRGGGCGRGRRWGSGRLLPPLI